MNTTEEVSMSSKASIGEAYRRRVNGYQKRNGKWMK